MKTRELFDAARERKDRFGLRTRLVLFVALETEVSILQELRKINNKSKIIVAQRVTSVQEADEIIILQNGRITERGKHEELLALNGYYAEIYRIAHQDEEVGSNG